MISGVETEGNRAINVMKQCEIAKIKTSITGEDKTE